MSFNLLSSEQIKKVNQASKETFDDLVGKIKALNTKYAVLKKFNKTKSVIDTVLSFLSG